MNCFCQVGSQHCPETDFHTGVSLSLRPLFPMSHVDALLCLRSAACLKSVTFALAYHYSQHSLASLLLGLFFVPPEAGGGADAPGWFCPTTSLTALRMSWRRTRSVGALCRGACGCVG